MASPKEMTTTLYSGILAVWKTRNSIGWNGLLKGSSKVCSVLKGWRLFQKWSNLLSWELGLSGHSTTTIMLKLHVKRLLDWWSILQSIFLQLRRCHKNRGFLSYSALENFSKPYLHAHFHIVVSYVDEGYLLRQEHHHEYTTHIHIFHFDALKLSRLL